MEDLREQECQCQAITNSVDSQCPIVTYINGENILKNWTPRSPFIDFQNKRDFSANVSTYRVKAIKAGICNKASVRKCKYAQQFEELTSKQ